MKNFKNKRTIILSIILVGLLVVAYKVIFMTPTDSVSDTVDNASASQRVEALLSQVESINFNTSVMEDAKFKSLKNIESALLSLPTGRKDPFAPVGQ